MESWVRRLRLNGQRGPRAGCGSHVRDPGGENPNGGLLPDHGSGTRQPSRPRVSPFVRLKTGSWSTSSGRSSTLRQAQLLALVDVRVAGQREHQQGGGACPPGAECEVRDLALPVGEVGGEWSSGRTG